jgi:ABC-type phosphate transport system auxiliary subunit
MEFANQKMEKIQVAKIVSRMRKTVKHQVAILSSGQEEIQLNGRTYQLAT